MVQHNGIIKSEAEGHHARSRVDASIAHNIFDMNETILQIVILYTINILRDLYLERVHVLCCV